MIFEGLADKLQSTFKKLRGRGKITEADVAEGELAGLAVKVERADGEKCPRCWHYATDIGANAEHAEICGRCVENVVGEGETRNFA